MMFVYLQDYAVQYWISGGFPSTKISLGIPLYGKAWTFSGNTAVRSAATGAAPAGPIVQQSGTLGYIEVSVCILDLLIIRAYAGLYSACVVNLEHSFQSDEWTAIIKQITNQQKTGSSLQLIWHDVYTMYHNNLEF